MLSKSRQTSLHILPQAEAELGDGGTHLPFFRVKVAPPSSQKNGTKPHEKRRTELPGFTHFLHRSPFK